MAKLSAECLDSVLSPFGMQGLKKSLGFQELKFPGGMPGLINGNFPLPHPGLGL